MYLQCLNAHLAYIVLDRFSIVEVLVGAFNKKKAAVGAL